MTALASPRTGLQPREPHAPRLVNLLRSPKRVRAVFGGQTIAQSRAVLVLRANHFLPVYFFPLDAVAPGVLHPSPTRGRHEAGGPVRRWHVEAGGRRAEDAAWSLDPEDGALAELQGHVAFEWRAMDAWFEEDEEVFVHARDPYARIDALRSDAHVEVTLGGETLADSRRAVLLFETHLPTRFYFPHEDVRLDRLVPSTTTSRCPYKGIASYWSARLADGSVRADVAWEYRDPIPEIPKIRNLIAFYPDRVDAIRLDGAPA